MQLVGAALGGAEYPRLGMTGDLQDKQLAKAFTADGCFLSQVLRSHPKLSLASASVAYLTWQNPTMINSALLGCHSSMLHKWLCRTWHGSPALLPRSPAGP